LRFSAFECSLRHSRTVGDAIAPPIRLSASGSFVVVMSRSVVFGFVGLLGLAWQTGSVSAQSLTEALALAYSNNPQLNAARAQTRATDEGMGIALGAARPAAVEFSFLVGIPTMFAAGGYKLLKAVKAGETAVFADPATWVAFATATVSAFLVVRWLLHYVQTRDFKPFAWYRLALGVALLAMLAIGL